MHLLRFTLVLPRFIDLLSNSRFFALSLFLIVFLDLDEVWVDSQPENAAKIKMLPPDEDLPGIQSIVGHPPRVVIHTRF